MSPNPLKKASLINTSLKVFALLILSTSSALAVTLSEQYEVLGLAPGATKEQVLRAFRELNQKYHPERHHNRSASGQELEILNKKTAAIMRAKDAILDSLSGSQSVSQTAHLGMDELLIKIENETDNYNKSAYFEALAKQMRNIPVSTENLHRMYSALKNWIGDAHWMKNDDVRIYFNFYDASLFNASAYHYGQSLDVDGYNEPVYQIFDFRVIVMNELAYRDDFSPYDLVRLLQDPSSENRPKFNMDEGDHYYLLRFLKAKGLLADVTSIRKNLAIFDPIISTGYVAVTENKIESLYLGSVLRRDMNFALSLVPTVNNFEDFEWLVQPMSYHRALIFFEECLRMDVFKDREFYLKSIDVMSKMRTESFAFESPHEDNLHWVYPGNFPSEKDYKNSLRRKGYSWFETYLSTNTPYFQKIDSERIKSLIVPLRQLMEKLGLESSNQISSLEKMGVQNFDIQRQKASKKWGGIVRSLGFTNGQNKFEWPERNYETIQRFFADLPLESKRPGLKETSTNKESKLPLEEPAKQISKGAPTCQNLFPAKN
ncbi:MAG: J domain-containing protein [Bdellovibrio sp.]